MNREALLRRANEALSRARELETRCAGDDASADDQAALDAALDEAQQYFDQAAAAESRSNRLRELQTRASSPGERLAPPMMPHTDERNTRGGRHGYSLLRAIRGQVDAIQGRGSLDGLEYEVHQELAARRGKAPTGVLVPWDVPVSRDLLPHNARFRADLTTSTGAGAIGDYTMPTMIDVLRARLVLVQLGASLITDQRQHFSLPRTTVTVTPGHVSTEGTNVANSSPTIDDINFTYKSIEASTKLTRQFINGASVSAENYIVGQITKAVANEMQLKSLVGSGTNGEPLGLFKMTNGTDGIYVKALGTDGANPAWADVLAITGAVDTANAPDDHRSWLFNPTTVAYLQGVSKGGNYPRFILDTDGQVAGYGYASTSLVPNNLTKGVGTGLSALAFGAWSDMLLALFTGCDLFVDPFSLQPHVKVTAAQDYDMHLAHPAAWAICTDVKTV